jgi:hypothetical protein
VAAWLWISDEAIAAWRAPPGMDAPMKVKGSIERSAGTSVDVLCQKASLPVRRWAHARRRCHPSVLLNRRARRTPIPLSATSTSRRSRNGIGWDGNARSVMAATPSAQLRCRVISSQVYSDGQVAGDPAMTVENLINAIKAGVLVNGRHIVDVSFSGRSGGGAPRLAWTPAIPSGAGRCPGR